MEMVSNCKISVIIMNYFAVSWINVQCTHLGKKWFQKRLKEKNELAEQYSFWILCADFELAILFAS